MPAAPASGRRRRPRRAANRPPASSAGGVGVRIVGPRTGAGRLFTVSDPYLRERASMRQGNCLESVDGAKKLGLSVELPGADGVAKIGAKEAEKPVVRDPYKKRPAI